MLNRIRLGKYLVGDIDPIFIVAETGNCHEGSLDVACRMVDEIAVTGANAVKFQLHIPEEEMLRSHPKFQTQSSRSLTIEELSELKARAEKLKLYFLCTPFSRKAADQLESIGVDAFKIGSGELTDLPFIEYVASKGKPMIVSSGMSEYKEVAETVKIIRSYSVPFILLHCVSIYPPKYEFLNLGSIPKMREYFDVSVGLSDHTPEIFSAIAAVPYRVSLIEKHFTLDRGTVGSTDHKVSLELHEFKMMVDGVRKIEKALGKVKVIFQEERPVMEWARRAVVSLKNISAGEVISADAVSTKRPLYDGIPAKYLPQVVGRKIKRNIPADSLIKWEDLE